MKGFSIEALGDWGTFREPSEKADDGLGGPGGSQGLRCWPVAPVKGSDGDMCRQDAMENDRVLGDSTVRAQALNTGLASGSIVGDERT